MSRDNKKIPTKKEQKATYQEPLQASRTWPIFRILGRESYCSDKQLPTLLSGMFHIAITTDEYVENTRETKRKKVK